MGLRAGNATDPKQAPADQAGRHNPNAYVKCNTLQATAQSQQDRGMPASDDHAHGRVLPWQRFNRKTQDCLICGGDQDDRRRQGIRCHGFIEEDGAYVQCSREDYAGNLTANHAGLFRHRIDGQPCYCGQPHGVAQPVAPPRPAKIIPPPVHRGPFPATLDGFHLAAQFDYPDADGVRQFSVLRYESETVASGKTKPDKTFRQVRWLDAERWTWGLGDAVPTLYRLPEVLAANTTRAVFIVEGEKAAEALRAAGAVATTCPMGARKWHLVTGRHDALRGRHVIILPDQDDDGRAHAQAVATDLRETAASVRIVELPGLAPSEDVVEWLARGGSLVALLELALCSLAIAHEAGNSLGENQDETGDDRAEMLMSANRNLNNVVRFQRRVLTGGQAVRSVGAAYTALREHILTNEWKAGEDGTVPVYLPKIAEASGMGTATAGRKIDLLASMQVIRKTTRKVTNAEGMPVDRVFVARGPLFDQPEAWELPEGAQHGGKRPGAGRPRKCASCGSEDLVQRTIRETRCNECGEITREEVTPWHAVNVPETEADAEADAEAENQDDTGVFLDSRPFDPSTDVVAENQDETGWTSETDSTTTTPQHIPSVDTYAIKMKQGAGEQYPNRACTFCGSREDWARNEYGTWQCACRTRGRVSA